MSGKERAGAGRRILTVRCHGGLSGDMLLAGLSRMLDLGDGELDGLASAVSPELAGCLSVRRADARGIGGWRAYVDLPRSHVHRTLADLLRLLDASSLAPEARDLAKGTFSLLARAEGAVHGVAPEDVHFHEVGALDSLLDIGVACALFARLAPDAFVSSPLPMADGSILCAHGVLPSPAPAVLELLDGVPVTAFPGSGETVTPTALALLKALGADFGPWPSMVVERHATAFGSRIFPDAPNGATFALGRGI